MPGKPNSSLISKEWFVRGEHDLQAARLIFEKEAYGDIVASLIQQAVEKYLKGYLLGLGWKLAKTHDLEVLISEAMTHDKGFAEFLDFARVLSVAYLESRYPPGLPREFSRQELSSMMEQAERLVSKIRSLSGY